MLAARLGGCVEGTLQLSPSSELDGDSLDEGVMEPLLKESGLVRG